MDPVAQQAAPAAATPTPAQPSAPTRPTGPLPSEVIASAQAKFAADKAAEASKAPATAVQPQGGDTAQASDSDAAGEQPQVRKPIPAREPAAAKIKSPREGFIAREAKRQAKEKAAQEQSTLTAQLEAERQARAAETERLRQLNAAKETGDVDEVLKLLGFESFEQAQKSWLEKRGALPKQDPKVPELEKQVQTLLQRLEERDKLEQQQREAAELNGMLEADRKAVQQFMVESGFERVDKLAEKPFAVQLLHNLMAQNPEVDDVEHVRTLDETYANVLKELGPIYGWAPPTSSVSAEQAPSQVPTAKPAVTTGLPQRGSGETGAGFEFRQDRAKMSQKEVDDERRRFLEYAINKSGTAQ